MHIQERHFCSAKGKPLMGGDVDSRSPGASTRRIFAMVVAIGCHLGLLLVLLRPAARRTDTTPMVDSDATVLHVRLISPPRPSSGPPAPPAPRPVARSANRRQAPVKEAPAPYFRKTGTRPSTVDSTHASRLSVTTPEPPAARKHYTTKQVPAGNRDFRERLFDARHAHDIHGVPGSDARVAPGIQLVDPTDQGIGAVMRRAQRLFGVTSRHCVDVEVWRHLTPRELDARHLSTNDVERQAAKYGCDRPLGLSF